MDEEAAKLLLRLLGSKHDFEINRNNGKYSIVIHDGADWGFGSGPTLYNALVSLAKYLELCAERYQQMADIYTKP